MTRTLMTIHLFDKVVLQEKFSRVQGLFDCRFVILLQKLNQRE